MLAVGQLLFDVGLLLGELGEEPLERVEDGAEGGLFAGDLLEWMGRRVDCLRVICWSALDGEIGIRMDLKGLFGNNLLECVVWGIIGVDLKGEK